MVALSSEERDEFEGLREIARSVPAKNRTNRRVLVIDEIQSKRHQEGREQGYSITKEEYQKRLDALETEAGDRLNYVSSQGVLFAEMVEGQIYATSIYVNNIYQKILKIFRIFCQKVGLV